MDSGGTGVSSVTLDAASKAGSSVRTCKANHMPKRAFEAHFGITGGTPAPPAT
jgi:hypothetical protein